MRDKASSEDLGSVARGVAGADTMQALTGRPTLSGARSVDESADLASAAVGQMAAASAQGLAAQRQQQTGVFKNCEDRFLRNSRKHRNVHKGIWKSFQKRSSSKWRAKINFSTNS